ncbi:hypothetical protein [Clostridium perfringens]|nr:hypothetical protein [Clostridium perfringens]
MLEVLEKRSKFTQSNYMGLGHITKPIDDNDDDQDRDQDQDQE